MKLDTICYNKYHKIRHIVIIFIGMLFLFEVINNRWFNFEIPFFNWSLILIFSIWVYLNSFVDPYNKIGKISIYKDGQVIIEQNSQLNKEQIRLLKFYYGGYNGKMKVYKLFLTGSWFLDGSDNFLYINDKKYQILINEQADLNSLISIVHELHNKGINAEYIKKIK